MSDGTVWEHQIALSERDGTISATGDGSAHHHVNYEYAGGKVSGLLGFITDELTTPDWVCDQENVSYDMQCSYLAELASLFRRLAPDKPILSTTWVRDRELGDALKLEVGDANARTAFNNRVEKNFKAYYTIRRAWPGRQTEVGFSGTTPPLSTPRAMIFRSFRHRPQQ